MLLLMLSFVLKSLFHMLIQKKSIIISSVTEIFHINLISVSIYFNEAF